MFTVYIQKPGGEFPRDFFYSAFEGFDHAGNKIIFFEDINEVPKRKNKYGFPPLVVAFIEDTIKFFLNCGISAPMPLDIPDQLLSFANRKVEVKTLREFKEDTELPIFVKPHSRYKAFSSGVIKETSSRKTLFNHDDLGKPLDEDMLVLTSEVVDMVSEYRCFIKKGEIVGIRHYQGDCTIFPDVEVIKDAIDAYKSAPIAYSLDFAVVKKTIPSLSSKLGFESGKQYDEYYYQTSLIEVQDMWSIGSYGLHSDIYVSMLKLRWFEIFK